MKSNWEGSEGVGDGPARPSPSLGPAGGTDPRGVGTVIILLSLAKQCRKGNPGQWRAGSEDWVGHGLRALCRVWE